MTEPGGIRPTISAIVPTIGRPDSLRRLFLSLASQTMRVTEVIVADGSGEGEIAKVIGDPSWASAGLMVKRLAVVPPNAVRQRVAAIAESSGEWLLLLDDDVALESDCVASMVEVISASPEVAAVCADFNNQSWAMPTRAWRFYLRHVLGMAEGSWQGRVVGPLLRFGFSPSPLSSVPIEWIGTGNTLLRRSAYEQSGGFSEFFLHRCTINEDVDLGLKVARVGRIVFCPAARMGHYHDPVGRVSPRVAAEDDLYNRYLVMRRTQGRTAMAALRLVSLYYFVESASHFAGSVKRLQARGFASRFAGRSSALLRIVAMVIRRRDPDA